MSKTAAEPQARVFKYVRSEMRSKKRASTERATATGSKSASPEPVELLQIEAADIPMPDDRQNRQPRHRVRRWARRQRRRLSALHLSQTSRLALSLARRDSRTR
jgi:hypothetical protein